MILYIIDITNKSVSDNVDESVISCSISLT